jgi:catechol 2,3-dioxygenase-like lactoylglutathione lyase family enzyme
MLGSAPVITFLATTNTARSRAFYEHTIGLTFVSDDPFAMVFTAAGVMLRIVTLDTFAPMGMTVLGWTVEDIAGTVDALRERGVTFERYPGMTQDDAGVWASPSGAKVAWFKDPDGNLLSLTQF